MRAVVFEHYGPPDVLSLRSVERPTPAPDEVLVKVKASTVNRADVHTREANRSSGIVLYWISRLIFGLRRPRRPILGSEFAGDVVAIGSSVTEFKVGDTVFGNTGIRFGAHAEYVAVRESSRIATIPAGLGYEEAAAISDGALNALGCLRNVDFSTRPEVLVYGASGSIGTAGVQLVRHLGAIVTAVTSTKNLDLVRALNPDHLVDRDREDFTQSGKRYDVILDAVGKLRFGRCRGSLKETGLFLPTDGLANVVLAFWTAWRRGPKVVFLIPPRQPKEDLLFLKRLVETGEFRPVIDRRYPLEEVVEASRYVETQRKRGNVILTLA